MSLLASIISLILLESQLITADKKDPFNAIITAAMTAQAGATLAVAVKSKSQKVKALAFPATISALLGITEPAIFGVNLRYVKPFVIALGAGAVGGWIASIVKSCWYRYLVLQLFQVHFSI